MSSTPITANLLHGLIVTSTDSEALAV